MYVHNQHNGALRVENKRIISPVSFPNVFNNKVRDISLYLFMTPRHKNKQSWGAVDPIALFFQSEKRRLTLRVAHGGCY